MTSIEPSPEPYYTDSQITLHHGDSLAVLKTLPEASVDCCVTSPPYFGLRDYGSVGQYGLESSPTEYVETMRALFSEVRRVLTDDGTLWLNIGDSYSHKKASGPQGATGARASRTFTATGAGGRSGLPEKNLLGIPWRVAFALQDDGWILRNDIIWSKSNAMPEPVVDRLSTRHEHMFLLSKASRYWFNLDPIREPHTTSLPVVDKSAKSRHTFTSTTKPGADGYGSIGYSEGGRNPGDVWTIATQPFAAAHFAVMPQALAERVILAGCKPGGTVLDPFSGSGTTGLAATKHGRKYVGIDLSSDYLDLSLRTRFGQPGLDLDGGAA